MKLTGKHWIIRAVNLFDKTDYHDCYVSDRKLYMHRDNLLTAEGRIFFLEDPETDNAFVITVQAPDYVIPTITIKAGELTVEDGGYPVTVTPCKRGECEQVCRALYREIHKRKTLITMSNTWGDMNSRDCVYESFVKKEIDTAAEIGVDIVQIDDGWQTIIPSGASKDAQGRRCFFDPMWELNYERFPQGMAAITAYAKERGVMPGLWFAPDSGDGFVRRERDLKVLKKAYEEWGMRFFKLDMLSVLNREECDIFLDMVNTIESFGPDAEVELDVTNGIRLGYLCGAEHGILFIENRYVKTTTYYPHRALRNLWHLSRYLPTCRFQFEIVNPDLAVEAYGIDRYAPVYYDLDWLFASVAVSNPLFWMEMQFLTAERKAQLARIFPVWKEHREALATADVSPIGQEPDGQSITGFCAVKGEDVYLVLLREVSAEDTLTYTLPVPVTDLEILASNTELTLTSDGSALTATFGKQRGYGFIKGKLQK
ncbi:MAG: glycoside hydrolase family 97 catalytic domain-containing protein [Clostridia bacterium]|nr:glycoside hydrolase family 97 catalytic domain-containing protein [Clostridia bacterium]